jgi:hypothetical protein
MNHLRRFVSPTDRSRISRTTLPNGLFRKLRTSFIGDIISLTRAGDWGLSIQWPRQQSAIYRFCRRIEPVTKRDRTSFETGRAGDALPVTQFVYGVIKKLLQPPVFLVDPLGGGG